MSLLSLRSTVVATLGKLLWLLVLVFVLVLGQTAPVSALAQPPLDETSVEASEEQPAAPEATSKGNESNDAVAAESLVPLWRPIAALVVGVCVVLFLMIGLKSHAFVALILGALVISCFVPLDVTGFVKSPLPAVIRSDTAAPMQIVKRVTSSFGSSVADIGILIAMAAIIGKCMLVSGAADRVVQACLSKLGEKRAAWAMMVSGFVLAVPVFFDTVFYLLVPLARSLYRKTQQNYLLYLAAIAAGGAITHTLVPPTPGPLLVANAVKADLGLVMVIGLAVGFPSSVVGLAMANWLNRRMPIPMRPMAGSTPASELPLEKLPGLFESLIPVLLPVLLITLKTVCGILIDEDASQSALQLKEWMDLIGDANLAMIAAALFSVYLCWKVQGHPLHRLAEHVEDALLSGGVIILITAAGGAFGLLLGMSEIHVVVESFFGRDGTGFGLLLIAYLLSAALKIAQGSSTVAMIVASSLIVSIMPAEGALGFHVAYFVPAIGAGSLMGSWMNDSGFWVFAKMGVLTESETLSSWTVLLATLSLTSFLFTCLFAFLLPLQP